jgi:hypothetical protein
MENNNWHWKIEGTAGESVLPHAMYRGNSDKDISAVTSALRKGIQTSIWTQAVVLIISAQTWSMGPECQALRDPLGIAGNIFATRSYQQRETTLHSIIYSRDHAKAAVRAEQYGNVSEAKQQWDIVFNGHFPE